MAALRALGSSDLRVSPIGLGCWQFSKGSGLLGRYWPELPDMSVREIVEKSIAGGVNWFDTAEAYGWGTSEQTLSSALSSLGKRGGEVIIASKWWPGLRTSRSIVRTIDVRLRRLGGFPLDLYQVHQPLGFSSVEKEMDAMARIAERGKIRYIGVSNFNEKRMRRADTRLRAHGLRLISNQVSYSLLNREIESNGVLQSARELGISVIAYSPLSQGLLTGKYHVPRGAPRTVTGIRRYLRSFSRSGLERTRPLVDILVRIGASHGVTPAQVALQWLIAIHGDCVVAIPGASSPRQAEENAAAMDIPLAEDELGVLDAESKRIAAASAG